MKPIYTNLHDKLKYLYFLNCYLIFEVSLKRRNLRSTKSFAITIIVLIPEDLERPEMRFRHEMVTTFARLPAAENTNWKLEI